MPVIDVDPRTDDVWQRLVDATNSDVFHSPAWMRVLGDSYGFDVRAKVATDDGGEPVGGIPYCLVDGVKGARVSSIPFSDYCDPLVPDFETWNALVAPLLELGPPLTLRTLHNGIPAGDDRFDVTGDAKWHGVVLEDDLDQLWAGIAGSARRAVRKAESAGIEIRPAVDKADLRTFYDLHLRVRKYRHGLLAQPYRFFENIYDEFLGKGDGTLLMSISEGEVVGGVLYLQWQDKLYYKFNAWDSSQTSARPNDAVMWSGIEHAKKAGLSLVDLGLSDSDQEGLLRYKRKYAQREGDITFLTSTRSDNAGVQSMGVVTELVGLLTSESVPDQVTESAGRALYHLFA